MSQKISDHRDKNDNTKICRFGNLKWNFDHLAAQTKDIPQ